MPITPGEPAAATADLAAALDALQAGLDAGRPTLPVPALEQQAYSAFYHS